MIVSDEALKKAVKKAFEEGWSATSEGHNAECHSFSSESLAELRDDAVNPILEELKAMRATPPTGPGRNRLGDAVASLYELRPHPAAEERASGRYDVKLVDASGCLRLDCNGHRLHLTHEQARDLMLKLAAGLDDGAECEARCIFAQEDSIALVASGDAVIVELVFAPDDCRVFLSPKDAEKIGRALLALSLECKGS